MGYAMIKIRYRDPNELSPGLHAEAERHGRNTTVYLLSGLTAQQRRAALHRLRISARMGYCPALPAGQLALALVADRIMTGVGRAGAVFRLHPAGSTVPVMVLSGGAIAFLLLSTVSIHVLPEPRTPGQPPAYGPAPVASAGAVPLPGGSQAPVAGAAGGKGEQGVTGQTGSGGGQPSQPQPGVTSPVISGTGTATGGGNGDGGTTLGGGSDTTPGAGASAGTTAPAASTSTQAATPSPSTPAPAPTASPTSGICLDIGPLGICLG
jgi:hypothetical protein